MTQVSISMILFERICARMKNHALLGLVNFSVHQLVECDWQSILNFGFDHQVLLTFWNMPTTA